MERTIYNQQFHKERLLKTVVDEYGVSRHFTRSELNQAFDLKEFKRSYRKSKKRKRAQNKAKPDAKLSHPATDTAANGTLTYYAY